MNTSTSLPRSALRRLNRLPALHPPSIRTFSSTPHLSSKDKSPPSSISPRWLSDTKQRIGKCISSGLSPSQFKDAARLCHILGTEWRDLTVGAEGFLTGKRRAGLIRQGVVWGEMDSMQHVNNVTYVRYAESARVNWATNFGLHIDPDNKETWMTLMTPKGVGLILKSIKVDYKFPMTYPDRVSVFHKLRHAPFPSPSHDSSSFLLDVLILSETAQRPAARCYEDLVVYDYTKIKKVDIPPFMVRAFENLWEEQEASRKRAMERISQIEMELEALEAETWNTKEAAQDMGSKEAGEKVDGYPMRTEERMVVM